MSKASSFFRALIGGLKSNTMRGNGLLLTILGAVASSDIITTNPEYVTILSAVTIVFNMFMRTRTDTALSDR